MGDALTPHGMEAAVDPAPPPSRAKRPSPWSLWGIPDRVSDGFVRATDRLFHRLASLLGALLFPDRRLRPADLRPLAGRIRARMALFDGVQALADPEVVAPSLRSTLRQRVHALEREFALAMHHARARSGAPAVAVALTLLVYAAFVLFNEGAIARVLRVSFPFDARATGLFWAVHLVAISFFFQLPNELIRVRREHDFPSGAADVVAAFMPAILGLPCLAAAYLPAPLPVRFLLLAIGQAGLYYAVFLTLFLPFVALVQARGEAAPRRAHPDAFIAHELLLALLILDADRGDLSAETKVLLLPLLDSAARSIRDGLPRRYRSSDLAMNDWLTESARQWAAALDDLKKWVITPRHDTREQLTRHLASQYAFFVMGTWDALARKAPEAGSRRRIGRALIADAARTLLTAAIPLLALLLIQRSPLALAGAAAASATLTVVVFALVVFLSAVQPDLDTPIAGTKSVLDLLKSALNLLTFGKGE